MRTVRAIRYLTPLREGGSVPAIVEADDDGTYVAKFRGAAQGPRALVAELIAGELGRLLGLPVPQLVLIEVDAVLARSEPDPEIQDLLRNSAGLNVALDYLPGALNWEPGLAHLGVQAFVAAQLGLWLGGRLDEALREGAERVAGLILIAAAIALVALKVTGHEL